MLGPLDAFARAARARKLPTLDPAPRAPSLAHALRKAPGLVAEIKPASPTQGALREVDDPTALARALLDAGAAGISALAEPDRFGGSPQLVRAVAQAGGPTLWKDFVVTDAQLDAAADAGASAVLLILPLLTQETSDWASPEEAIAAARARGLESLLEVYDDEDYLIASLLDADMVGINNRDLRQEDLPVDPGRAVGVLTRCGPLEVPVLALSGAATPSDVREARLAGARGVLVGSALMRDADPAAKLKELAEGLR